VRGRRRELRRARGASRSRSISAAHLILGKGEDAAGGSPTSRRSSPRRSRGGRRRRCCFCDLDKGIERRAPTAILRCRSEPDAPKRRSRYGLAADYKTRLQEAMRRAVVVVRRAASSRRRPGSPRSDSSGAVSREDRQYGEGDGGVQISRRAVRPRGIDENAFEDEDAGKGGEDAGSYRGRSCADDLEKGGGTGRRSSVFPRR